MFTCYNQSAPRLIPEYRLVTGWRNSCRLPLDWGVSMKICTKCKAEKPFTEFSNSARYKDGVRTACKSCDAAYRAVNREKIKAYKVEYRAANREIINARQAERRQANPEKFRAWDAKYYNSNPEKCAARKRNRRARKRSAEGKHTSADIRAIFESQRGLCANCQSKLFKSGKNKFHVDHIMPLALGGSNWPSNLQCLCPSCNLKKSAKDPFKWAAENGRLL